MKRKATEALLKHLSPDGPSILRKKKKEEIQWKPFLWETSTPEMKQKIMAEVVDAAGVDAIPIGPPCACILESIRYNACYAQLCIQKKLDEKKTHHRVFPRFLFHLISDFLLPSKKEIIWQSIKDPAGDCSFVVASFGWCSENYVQTDPVGKHITCYLCSEDEDADTDDEKDDLISRSPCFSYIITDIGHEPAKLQNFTPRWTFELVIGDWFSMMGIYNTHEVSPDLFWKYGGINEYGGLPYDDFNTDPFFDQNSDW